MHESGQIGPERPIVHRLVCLIGQKWEGG